MHDVKEERFVVMETSEFTEIKHEQEEVASRAYHLWEQNGRHHHRELECWLQAEVERGASVFVHKAQEPEFEPFAA
jgi:hypothetical protein